MPKLAAGEACNNNEDCSSNYCDFSAAVGQCAAQLGAGEMCVDGSQCESQLCSEESGCADPERGGIDLFCGFFSEGA